MRDFLLEPMSDQGSESPLERWKGSGSVLMLVLEMEILMERPSVPEKGYPLVQKMD